MKKYIQPKCRIILMGMNTIIASSFAITENEAEEEAFTQKKKDMWGKTGIWD